jgi:lincosamide nucleotidyltransferase A/C/D/E
MMQTPHMTAAMSVEQAREIYELLEQSGVRSWVWGGWGVDALLGRVTREHKDLDLLVLLEDLLRYAQVVRQHGFERDLVWEESLPISHNGLRLDSAFVDAHPDGRDIDIHVINLGPQGEVIPIYADPWSLPPDPISGVGTIGGTPVRCVTRAAQIAMHSGYDLPDKQREDIRLLELEN